MHSERAILKYGTQNKEKEMEIQNSEWRLEDKINSFLNFKVALLKYGTKVMKQE